VLGCHPDFAAVAATASSRFDPIPLWEVYSVTRHEVLYTTSYAQRAAALRKGFVDHGVVAWLPCAPVSHPGPHGEKPAGGDEPDRGYPLPMDFDCARPADAAPFYAFASAAPGGGRFHTASAHGAARARTEGYRFERVDGYVFTRRVPGATALYRMDACAPGSEQCHPDYRYTISAESRIIFRRAGWHDGGIAGYVFDGYRVPDVRATFKGDANGVTGAAPKPATVPIRDVAPPQGKRRIAGDGRATFSGELAVNALPRPVGAFIERLSFTLHTGSLFDPGSNLDHLPIWLHAHQQFAADGIPGIPCDGLGIFLAGPRWGHDFCHGDSHGGGQVFVEEMGRVNVDCAANLAAPLRSHHRYDFVLSLADDATLGYTVTDPAIGTVVSFSKNYAADYPCPLHASASLPVAQAYCNNPYTRDRFPVGRSGYSLWPIFRSGDRSGWYEDMTIEWLDRAGKRLSILPSHAMDRAESRR
jgi:hypothetical protein